MWGGGDASGGILSELRHRRTWSTPCRLSLSEIPASHERKKSERLVKSRGSQAEGGGVSEGRERLMKGWRQEGTWGVDGPGRWKVARAHSINCRVNQ